MQQIYFWKISFQFSFCNRNEKKRTVSVTAFSNPTRNEKGNCIHNIKMCDHENISKGDLKCSIWIITKIKFLYMIILVTKVHFHHHFHTVPPSLDSSSRSFCTCARSPNLQLGISLYKLCKCTLSPSTTLISAPICPNLYVNAFLYLQNNELSSWLFISPVNSVAIMNKCSAWLHWTILMHSITVEDLVNGWITKVYFAVRHILCVVGTICVFEIVVTETAVKTF